MGSAAYADLKREIIQGDMAPASQWLEEEIAARLGMSRTPVREALVRLEQEGFVQITPRRGIRVRELTRRDVIEVNEVLECLELQATQRLAARGLSPEDMARLDATIAGMDEALASDDVHAWARADYAFHRLLIELAGNRHLEAVATTFLDKAHRFRVKTLEMRTRPLQLDRQPRRHGRGDPPDGHRDGARHPPPAQAPLGARGRDADRPPRPAAWRLRSRAARIALIHAVTPAIAPVEAAFAALWPEAEPVEHPR